MGIAFMEETDTHCNNWVSVEQWISNVILDESKSVGAISYVFMTDDALLKYNVEYLNHDFYTDVITFDDCIDKDINGDILVSIDRIVDNSNSLKISYKNEFLRVIVHGVLHLCGYKDKKEIDIKLMREKEQFYLNKVDFEL